MPYRIVDIELSEPLPTQLSLSPEQDGIGLLGRWHGRIIGFAMQVAPQGSVLDRDALERIFTRHFSAPILAAKTEAALEALRPPAPQRHPPMVSIAICTKDRAQRLKRLLDSLQVVRGDSPFPALEIIVVDNASVDSSTREAAQAYPEVRYVFEPRTGLDFARNAALHAANGELLCYLDDDVVVDRLWLHGLYRVWAECPDAGGYSGLVLPYRLDTRAQIAFEQMGGFGRGFARLHHAPARFLRPLHPLGAGNVGAGCNMGFQRSLLLHLGGFDEALDTGAPLPGGGDLDIFYRVMRAGYTIAYEPRYAVFHEHRETMAQLRRQFWTWGLGFMTFLVKTRRTDPPMRERQVAMLRWWFGDQLRKLFRGLLTLQMEQARFAFAELTGALQGLFGEYDRSIRRSKQICECVSQTSPMRAVQQ
jgi:glycosyltransferase involved in cell wall biosynthesis